MVRSPCKPCRTLQLDDVVGSNAEVVVGSDRATALALTAFMSGVLPESLDAPIADSSVEDDVDVGVILEALEQMPVQPVMLARDHELVSHRDAILRRPCIMHGQNSSGHKAC